MMDADRKKREPPDSDDPTQLKKPNIVPESPEAAEPKEVNIIRYQNREMHIRIKELRTELKGWEEKCRKLEEKSENCDETVSCTYRSWDQFISGLQLLLNNIDCSPSAVESKGQVVFPSLQLHSQCPINEDYEISSVLQDKLDRACGIFSEVLSAIGKEKLSTENFMRVLLENKESEQHAGVKEKAIIERVAQLEKDKTNLQASLSSAQEMCLKYTNEIRLLTARNTKNVNSVDSLKNELNHVKDEVDLLRRKVIKAEFPPFAGISIPKPAPLNVNPNTNVSTNNASSPTLPVEPKENGTALEAEMADMQALAESRLEEIKKLNIERQQHIKDLRALREEVDHPSAERVQASANYVRLLKEVQSLNIIVEDRENQIKNYKAEINRLTSSRRTDMQQIENTEFAKRRVLDKQIAELEMSVSSLLADRTDLITKLDQQLASTPSRGYMDELRQLLASKDSDIKKSREECERLREANRALTVKEERRRPDKSEEILLEKDNEIRDLIDRLRDSNKTLDDTKHKEKKWAEREHDYKIIIENFQTLSKESRTLADLRISERRLRDEVDDLRRHNDDLRRQIDKYSARADGNSIRELEKKHADELRVVKHEQEKRASQLEIDNKNLRAAMESQKQDSEVLFAEIENISKSYEGMQAQNTRLMHQLGDKEDATTKIIAESMKHKKDTIQALEECKLAGNRLSSVIERHNAQKAEILKYQETTQSLYEHIDKLQEELHHATAPQDTLRTKLAEAERVNQLQTTQLEHTDKTIQDFKKRLEDAAVDLEREKDRLRRLEEDKTTLKRKLERFPSNKLGSSSGGVTSLAEEELRVLKQRLRCSVCNDRTKDTVIAKCFHVFCQQCIHTNLQQRKRRCPGCSIKFSETDVHSLYDFAA